MQAADGPHRNNQKEAPRASHHERVLALIQVARMHGLELDAEQFRIGDTLTPTAAMLSEWGRAAGLWTKAVKLTWRHLLKMKLHGPVILLLKNGGAVLLTSVNAEQKTVTLQKATGRSDDTQELAVDELRLARLWDGETVLMRPRRGLSEADQPFSLMWLAGVVLLEKKALTDIAIGSLTLSVLTILPPLLVMATVNRVLQYHSTSTLVLISLMMAAAVIYEMILSHARRLIMSVVGARIDAKLSLHVFQRLLQLPLEFFEKNSSGETLFRIGKVYQIRNFITSKLLATGLDVVTLFVILPFLFYVSPGLTWIVVACAVAILLIIFAFLPAVRAAFAKLTMAETMKYGTLGETVVGIKTVKALALEPQRMAEWDERVAEGGKWHLAFNQLASWPQSLVIPLERMMTMGTLLLGAYWAINDTTGYLVGSLFAFMMLSQRVAQPLVGLAKLVEDFEEVGAAVHQVAFVLNRERETDGSLGGGLRPVLSGAISFENVSFAYPGTTTKALKDVSFSIPAGTMLGIVGKSGSGKSTITRLLQGINLGYTGMLKLDGCNLKEINLRHLRTSLGVVLQDNFLFRGSIRDNIIAGRAGLTTADVVKSARLAGAEEFIERMPNGFETYIEEGSPNLSGGQKQRLAIARGLIHDPRIIILDEATSALDPESEAIVNANLARIADGRTMVIVSHRLSSLTNCDQILVMEQGQVVDIGPHADLLERCTIYRQLWAQQNRHNETSNANGPVPLPRLIETGPR